MNRSVAVLTIIASFFIGLGLGNNGQSNHYKPIVASLTSERDNAVADRDAARADDDQVTVKYQDLVGKWNQQVADINAGVFTYSSYNTYETYSSGSTCRDGSHSYSTGRGTCSWHGGVLSSL